MRQILLLILLFFVGQWFFKTLRRAQPHARTGSDPRQQAPGAAQGTAQGNGGPFGANGPGKNAAGALPEPMVRCAECGVHAPRSESVSVGTQVFCSAEHARAYDARKSGQNRPSR